MRTVSPDTSPEAEACRIERIRGMTFEQKLARIVSPNRATRELGKSRLRARYPDASPEELRRRPAALWMGPEPPRKVLGFDPDGAGW